MKRKIECRRNSVSDNWQPVSWEIDLWEVPELNRAWGWQKFRIVEVEGDEAEPPKATDDTVPQVPELHYPRLDSAQVDFETVPDVSRCGQDTSGVD